MIYFIRDEIEISKLFYARQGEAEMTAAEKRARKRERKRLEEQRLFAEESANMTLEQKKTLLMQLGVPKAAAEHYLKQESDVWAVLPAFRFLKPLNDDLEFYKGGYKQMIERRVADGSLDERFPEVAALIKAGARFAGSLPEPAAFLASVGLQFFLKHLVFQFAAFRLCPCVAGCALGADCMDDVDLPQDGPVGRKAANTLSYLGRFCGLFESGRLALESIAPWI